MGVRRFRSLPFFAILFAMMAVIGSFALPSTAMALESGDTINMNKASVSNSHGGWCSRFESSSGVVYCLQPGVSAPGNGSYVIQKITASSPSGMTQAKLDRLRLILYYGAGGAGYDRDDMYDAVKSFNWHPDSGGGAVGNSDEEMYYLTHFFLGRAFGHTWGQTTYYESAYQDFIEYAEDVNESDSVDLSQMDIYAFNVNGSGQIMLIYDPEPLPSDGKLIVRKIISGKSDERTFHFHAKVWKGSEVYYDNDFDITVAANKSAKSKRVGGSGATFPNDAKYEITEKPPVTHGVTWSDNRTGTIDGGQTVTVKCTNKEKPSTLKVKKVSTGEGADPNDQFTFTIVVKHTGDNDRTFTKTIKAGETATVATDIRPNSTYTVTEYETAHQNDPRYTTVSWDKKTGTIGADETITATATNGRDTGELLVSKELGGPGARATDVFHFKVTLTKDTGGVYKTETFDLKGGESRRLTNIPTYYTYKVEETPVHNDYVLSWKNNSNTGTIRKNARATCTGHNERKTGNLELYKVTTGTGVRPTDTFQYHVTIMGDGKTYLEDDYYVKGGEHVRIEDIPTGYTYAVYEVGHEDYDLSWDSDHGVIEWDPVLRWDSLAKCTCTNERITGSLEVGKVITGTGARPDQDFHFKVSIFGDGQEFLYDEFTLKGGETKVFDDIPSKYEYVVSEVADGDYTLEWTDPREGFIIGHRTVHATAENTRKTGSFSVTKAVDRSDMRNKEYDKDRQFTVEVTLIDERNQRVNGTFGDMTFVDGLCTLSVKDKQVFTATKVPTRWRWSVRELNVPDGYTHINVLNAQGDVRHAEEPTKVVVNNFQEPGYGYLIKQTA